MLEISYSTCDQVVSKLFCGQFAGKVQAYFFAIFSFKEAMFSAYLEKALSTDANLVPFNLNSFFKYSTAFLEFETNSFLLTLFSL